MATTNESRGMHFGWFLVLLLLLGFVFVRCGVGSGSADTFWGTDDGIPLQDAVAAGLAGQDGLWVSATAVVVHSVPADEGFWVEVGTDLVWVQLQTDGESLYTVRPGQTVSFSGTVVAHGPAFPVTVGATEPADADRLVAQGVHVAVDENNLRFGVG
jgi:hypothetical protein